MYKTLLSRLELRSRKQDAYILGELLSTVDDLPEHVELVLVDLLNDDVNFLVCHQGCVQAALLGPLPLGDFHQHVELVLIGLLDVDGNLLVCPQGYEWTALWSPAPR